MQTQWTLIYLIHFIHVYAFQSCTNNRKVFTAKQGSISDGHLYYGNSERCEYLIKGEFGETVTLKFHIFHTECSYDHVFVHDGGSRSSKLLAVLTGKHDGTVLVSTNHMVFIILQSDDVAIGKGFNLTYTINQCPNSCSKQGTCNKHVCQCYNGKYGDACQHQWCPQLCNVNAVEGNKCNVTLKKCSCANGFYGEACSLSELPNTNLNSWHNVTAFSDILKARVGHVSVHIEPLNILLVHGGYSFEGIYDDIALYNYSSNKWMLANIIGQKPSARFDHAGIPYKDSFIIFGGELADGSYTNELWLYNCSTNIWQLLNFNPYIHGLKLHTINFAKSTLKGESLYVFGGQNNNQSLISSQIYIYNLNKNTWSNPPHIYGKDLYLRVYGHSAIFYEDLGSLVVFGGFHANISLKPGELTNRLLLYNIDNNVWSILSNLANVPPALAYHTAVVSGNYMIIFGGLTFETLTANCPLSSKIYYYNLHCNIWVGEEILTKQYENKPSKWYPGVRFSHTAVIKNKQTLIIIGGYDQTSILSGVVAYQLPKTVVFLNTSSRTEQHGIHCVLYTSKELCMKDPSCVYCSQSCFPNSRLRRNSMNHCEHNCKGICRLLHSCETCTIQSMLDIRKQDDLIKGKWCSWCTLDRTCFNREEHISKCQISKEEISKCKLASSGFSTATWWESNEGFSITNLRDCQMLDNRTGLTMLQYINKPYKDDYPDGVKILKSSSDIQYQVAKKLLFPQKIVVIGIVYPYFCYKNIQNCHHKILLEGSKSVADLYISESNWRFNQSMKQVAHLDNTVVRYPQRKGGLFPFPSMYHGKTSNLSYVLKLIAEVEKHGSSYLKLSWNHTDGNEAPSFHDITANYLELYQFGDCFNYSSCMGCITDSLCGWRHSTNNCILLSEWWKDSDENKVCLSREESQCVKCDDYFDCQTCLMDSFCVWQKYEGCKRKVHSNALYVINKQEQCHPTCKHFYNLDDCVKNGVACVWCSQKKICISHYEYHLHNHFGQCYTFDLTSKKPCYKFDDSCSNCMKQFECGWVFNDFDPRIGRCTEGDFIGPYIASNLSSSANASEWEYEKCPDINECILGIDVCKNNSKCINHDGSYECKCDDGFEGDGKTFCKRMCWPRCVQGECTTEIKCKCDFGWKGEDCSIDCGCYNHSTCFNKTCDKCQNLTRGDNCEYCVNGSYGNAMTIHGCKKCYCSNNGDPQRNICNIKDGTCYCLNNTAGNHCENCLPNFSHVPKEYKDSFPGHICHLNCNRSTIHFVNSSGWLVASHSKNTSPFITCLWILAGEKLSHDSLIYNQTKLNSSILLRLHILKASCSESHLSIYDGIPPNPRTEEISLKSSFKLLNSVCNLDSKNRVYRSETGILSLLYEGRTSKDKDDLPGNELLNGLLAEYQLLSCPDNCPAPFICSTKMRCICKDGWYGSLCENEKCKNNCSSIQGGGTCNEIFQCQCNFGFYGDDCSKQTNKQKFSTEHLKVMYNNNINKDGVERLGSTMVLHGHTLYVFGGSHFNYFYQPVFVQFNVHTNGWKKLEFPDLFPSVRFAHCSFVYNGGVYIYGGIGESGVLKDIWKFNISKNMWEEMKNLSYLKPLAGHSCTLVNQTVFIFGGYVPDEGLNEFPIKLYLGETTISNPITFHVGKPKPTGMYSHVAVYDDVNENIYFHGGMAFYQEKVQPSHRIYVFNIRYVTWNYVEELAGEIVPSLVGHTGQLIGGYLYIFGGYTDRIKFSPSVYVWKIKCNRWVTLKKDDDLDGDGQTDQMFLNSAKFNNGSIFIFGGFKNKVSSNMNLFSIPSDLCGRHTSQTLCLQDDCHWCENFNRSACYHETVPSMCIHNGSTIINPNMCKKEHTLERKCDSFTSCITCLSSYPHLRTRCHWCRCPQETGTCHTSTDSCNCIKHTTLNKCWEVFCEASSCRNCGENCIWTNFLRYKSESKRILNRYGLEFNCFLKSLSIHLPSYATIFQYPTCPKACNSYSTCETCLKDKSFGVHAGTKYCIWSDKLSGCLSVPILPIRCSFGRCGQLYFPSMQKECPAPCSARINCIACIKSVGCGWCEKNGSGICMKGGLTGPYESKCGYAGHHFHQSIVTVYSIPYTWAYASCPAKDECFEGVDDCKEIEVCHDMEVGYLCLCKEGYERTESSEICKPVCKGCEKGTCDKPNECTCFFGWTGKNCTVPCLCNGHSNCINATSNDICIQCFNNTQGKHCEECKPFFVGNPVNGEMCNPCKNYCNKNADICISKEERDMMKGNYSMLRSIRKGPKNSAVCINCTHFSFGPKCDNCLVGYFHGDGNNCTKCRCNGHSHTCDTKTGSRCNCSHNTKSKISSCKTNSASVCRSQSEQCSLCQIGYEGRPEKGSQCYKIISQSRVQQIHLISEHTVYFYVTPRFLNVNLRLNLDIFVGEVDVYITDAKNRIYMEENEVRYTQTLTLAEDVVLQVDNITSDAHAVFANYNVSGTVLFVKGVKSRLIIQIPFSKHEFTNNKFFIVLSSINKTREVVHGMFYFRQDQTKLNLTLFFLTLIVILMLILSGFIFGWKVRAEYVRQRRGNEELIQLQTLAKRPLACYKIRCERNEDIYIIRKRKDRNTLGKNKFSNAGQNNNSLNRITPLTVQNTEDYLASVITVMVQFPENEFSLWNLSLASGIFQANTQQLIQIKTSQVSQGRKVDTRIFSTQT